MKHKSTCFCMCLLLIVLIGCLASARKSKQPADRPHQMFLYTDADCQWVIDNRDKLTEYDFGIVVFFGPLYTTYPAPTTNGYAYKNPSLIDHTKAVLRAEGCKALGYFHCTSWPTKGLDMYDLMANAKQLDLDGVYLDNGQIGRNINETLAFFRELKRRGYYIYHHGSLEPHYGRVVWRGPWAQYEDAYLWGETNAAPTSLDDSLWADALKGSDATCVYKAPPGSPWRANHSLWIPKMVELDCTYRTGAGRGTWRKFTEEFYPAWKAAQGD